MAAYPACADVIGRLRLQVGKGIGVEDAIDAELERAESGHPELFGGLVALRFYLRRVVTVSTRKWADSAAGVTNYLALLRHLEYWRRSRGEAVLLVTFNYDDLLEIAAAHIFGLAIQSIDDYTNRDAYRVYKPHGSVNWLHHTVLPASEGSVDQLVSRGEEVTQDLAMVVTEGRNQIRFDDGVSSGRAVIPALAVPTKTKRGFVCPAQHLHDLEVRMGEVDRLLVLGWRAQETHFLHIMQERLTPRVLCTVVSGPRDGMDVRQHLAKETPLARFTPVEPVGFSDFVSDFDRWTADLLT